GEDRRCRATGDEGEEIACGIVRLRFDERDRVAYWLVRCSRRCVDDDDIGRYLRIGSVDDTGACLAARNPGERGPHIVACDHAWRDAVPEAEMAESFFRVDAGGYAVGIAESEPAVSERFGKVIAVGKTIIERFVLRRDEHEVIAEHVL